MSTAVAGVDASHQQQIGFAGATLIQRLRSSGCGAPHLGDIGVDDIGDAAQNEAADDEQRHHHQHADSHVPFVGNPADERQHNETGDDPQRCDAKAGGSSAGRNGQRERNQDARPKRGECGRNGAVECDGCCDVGRQSEGHEQHRGADSDPRQKADEALHVVHEVAGDEPSAKHNAHQLKRLGDCGGEPTTTFAKAELSVVEHRGKGDESGECCSEKRK